MEQMKLTSECPPMLGVLHRFAKVMHKWGREFGSWIVVGVCVMEIYFQLCNGRTAPKVYLNIIDPIAIYFCVQGFWMIIGWAVEITYHAGEFREE